MSKTKAKPRLRPRRWLKRTVGWAILLILVMATWVYVGRYGSTPAFVDANGRVIAGSVATIERLRLGGVEQSVVIRGRNGNAPIMIWLHGGPGQDETGLWRHYNSVLEDHFVLVYWVQRGTGRSYSDDIPANTMRISQFVADLDQLIGVLKSRFGKRQVTIVRHSWGTSFGVAYTQAHPENLAAYVGVGQVVNADEGEKRSYQFTLDEAHRIRNAEAIQELERIGPPPYGMDKILRQRAWLNAFGGAWHRPMTMPELLWTSFKASEMTIYDGIKFLPGQNFSQNTLAGENAKVDWLNAATRFQMPVFILTGRFDHNTDANLQHEYFEKIEAPSKQFRWFEKSAHSPPFEEPEAFNAYLIKEVLPVVMARQQNGG